MKVIIFTEGGKNIGFGHITRCIALYDAFKEKGVVPTLIINGDASAKNALKGRKCKILNWLKERNRLNNLVRGANIVIIDSYLAGIDFYKKISNKTRLCVYIDDTKRLCYPKGIVINGSVYADELGYRKKKGVIYLLGTKYMPLRREFWDISEKKINKKIKNILITFGGNDAANMTAMVLGYVVKEFPDLHKKVIIGAGFENIKSIEKNKDGNTCLKYYLAAGEMLKAMLDSDIAISAGGQTLYELAKVGVSTIAVKVADNQLLNIRGLRRAGFIEYVGQPGDRKLLNKIYEGVKKFTLYKERKRSKKVGAYLMKFTGARNIVNELMHANEEKI